MSRLLFTHTELTNQRIMTLPFAVKNALGFLGGTVLGECGFWTARFLSRPNSRVQRDLRCRSAALPLPRG